MKEFNFWVEFEKDEDGRVVASIPALPGCVADGATDEEAETDIRAAADAYINSKIAHG